MLKFKLNISSSFKYELMWAEIQPTLIKYLKLLLTILNSRFYLVGCYFYFVNLSFEGIGLLIEDKFNFNTSDHSISGMSVHNDSNNNVYNMC